MSTRAGSKEPRRAGGDCSFDGWQAVAVVGVAAALMAVVVIRTGSVSPGWTVVPPVAVVLVLLGLGLWGRH